jgi:hypothetical protein
LPVRALHAPDLTRRPPRSPRVRLGGYVILPRLLDKGRAQLAGTHGAYHYDCPLDRHFFQFAGIGARALLAELKKGSGDGDILAWMQRRSRTKPAMHDILAWSAWHEQRGPADMESHEYFMDLFQRVAPQREDICSWFDLLDVEDHADFGGHP